MNKKRIKIYLPGERRDRTYKCVDLDNYPRMIPDDTQYIYGSNQAKSILAERSDGTFFK